jgi:hypothetical protein
MSVRERSSVNVIPDRFHFVWSGRRIPYFARLAVQSVLVAEPAARVDLHIFGDEPGPGELDWLARQSRLTVQRFDPQTDFEGLGMPARALHALYERIAPTAVSARANLVRLAVLARFGGIYLDTDILVVAPFADLRAQSAFVGEERVLSIDNAWQAGERSLAMVGPSLAWGVGRTAAFAGSVLRSSLLWRVARRLESRWQTTQVNNAVIGARPGARFVRRLLEAALEADPSVRFALGPALIDRVAREPAAEVTILPSDVFYVVPPSYSFRFFVGGPLALPPHTRLLHVVSSNHRALLASLDATTIRRRIARGPYYASAANVLARLEAA